MIFAGLLCKGPFPLILWIIRKIIQNEKTHHIGGFTTRDCFLFWL